MLAQIVVSLAENYLHKGHHIYADRLYSSVPLVEELVYWDTEKSRHQVPSVVTAKTFKFNRGETRAWRDGKKWCSLGGIRVNQQL